MTHAAAQEAMHVDPPPAELLELSLELALAVHKRAIYPAGHPMLRGAVEALAARMRAVTDARGAVTLAVSADRVLIEGRPVDAANPILREFATHLHGHQLAAIRILPGVEPAEVDDVLGTLATSVRRVDRPLGALGEEALARWRHVVLYPLSFGALELREEGTDGAPGLTGRAAEIWADLAQAALEGEGGAGATPGAIAAAIGRRAGSASYDRGVLGAILRAAGEFGGLDSAHATSMRSRLSEIITAMSPEALIRLMQMGGDEKMRARFLHQSLDVLNASAMVNVVAAGASAAGAPISHAMLRLLTKLARNADAGHRPGATADPELRQVLGRLISHWSLDDPNPGDYGEALSKLSRSSAADTTLDPARDECEPERVVELSLEVGRSGEATERALGRLVVVHGLADVLDRLAAFPPAPLRDKLIDGLVNSNTLQEQLDAEHPDQRVLQHAVMRLRDRAVEPLLNALEARPEDDADWVAGLLVAVGREAEPILTGHLPGCARRVQHVLLTVFDRLDAWPEPAYLRELARHPDAALRREAVRLMLKHDAMRADAVVAGCADADERIFGLALAAALKEPTPRAAVALVRRLDADPELSAELRGRAARVIAASGSRDGMTWLVARLVRRHWLTRRPRLRKKSPEVVAGVGGLAAHWPDAPDASPVLALARASRDHDIRQAASPKPAAT